MEHGDVGVTLVDVWGARSHNPAAILLAAECGIREHTRQAIRLEGGAFVLKRLPHDVRVTDEDAAFHEHDVNGMIRFLCDPVAELVLADKAIRPLHP